MFHVEVHGRLTAPSFSPQYGLYSAFMGGFIYPLLGTSKDLTLGPTAIMSLLCASVVGGRPGRAVLLSLLCGTVQAALGVLRLGEAGTCGGGGGGGGVMVMVVVSW